MRQCWFNLFLAGRKELVASDAWPQAQRTESSMHELPLRHHHQAELHSNPSRPATCQRQKVAWPNQYGKPGSPHVPWRQHIHLYVNNYIIMYMSENWITYIIKLGRQQSNRDDWWIIQLWSLEQTHIKSPAVSGRGVMVTEGSNTRGQKLWQS